MYRDLTPNRKVAWKREVKTKGNYDILTVKIPTHDAWGLVPQEEGILKMSTVKFYPHKARPEKCRDAFGLL